MSIEKEYLEFCEGRNEDDITDCIHDFIGGLTRGDIMEIIEGYFKYQDLNK